MVAIDLNNGSKTRCKIPEKQETDNNMFLSLIMIGGKPLWFLGLLISAKQVVAQVSAYEEECPLLFHVYCRMTSNNLLGRSPSFLSVFKNPMSEN